MKTIKEILRGKYTSTDIYGAVNDWIEFLYRTVDKLPLGQLSEESKTLVLSVLSAIRKDILTLEKVPIFEENAITISIHFMTVENALRTGILQEKDELEKYIGKFVILPLEKLLAQYIDIKARQAV